MPTYLQADRPLSLTTPLGPDVLLLVGLQGREAISELFHFHLDLLAENDAKVPFDQLLGQKISAEVKILLDNKQESKRFFSGICNRVSQSGRDGDFTSYRMEVVPQFWLLTKRTQSRIFQYLSVPEILKKVLAGLDVTYEIQGTFQPREYCVQYRESDFSFASRLMEEEGIYYFFKHTGSGHSMVLANLPASHPDLTPPKAIYETLEGGNRPEGRVHAWEKSQELRSGKSLLWDHSFELPHKHLEADKAITDSVQVGTVAHKLKVGNNDKLELYDFPGGYAGRFDGVKPGGGEVPAEIQKIFQDNKRTVEIRMQAEAAQGIAIRGQSGCPQFTGGHKFTLEGHYNANGSYVLTSVEHAASLTAYRTGQEAFSYQNLFSCIPLALPYRPVRATPIPRVLGTQTAVVVGPPGEEIFTDKYSRIKVQFHWDREGKNDGNSSCWLRVATAWAGKQWGMIHIPRIGQEVLVDFMNGDINDPICIGSLYNADMMPPYGLPANKTQSGIKTRSSLAGDGETFNEICFEDKKGSELLYIRAEKDQTIAVENDEAHWVGQDRYKTIDRDETTLVHRDRTETVDRDETITITGKRTETLTGNETLTIKEGNREETIEMGNDKLTIKMGNREESIDMGNEKLTIKMGNREESLDMGNDSLTLKMGNQSTKLNLGKSETEALQSIELKVGQSSIKVDQMGVTIKGMMIKLESQIMTDMKSTIMTKMDGGVMLTEKGVITMIN
jgi:type VI secretion system secreted protein VgrG